MKLIIPEIPPSVNHMYANRVVNYRDKQGKNKQRRMRVLKKEAVEWKSLAAIFTNEWMRKTKWQTTHKKKVILNLWFYYPHNRHADTHNAIKILMDFLQDAGIYDNDKFALPRIIDFQIDAKNPRIEIEIQEVI